MYENERPEILSISAMRDYVIGIRSRDLWVPLGPHFAPHFLLGCHRGVVCDVYGVRPPDKVMPPSDIPKELARINEHYFTSENLGLTPNRTLWSSDKMGSGEYPHLWQVDNKSLARTLEGQTLNGSSLYSVYWANVRYRRNFERIVIVPRGSV